MQAIAQDTKVQQMQKELDDEKNSIGNLAAGEESLVLKSSRERSAWMNGYVIGLVILIVLVLAASAAASVI